MKITAKCQFWIDHIKAWQQTSLSIADYANQHKLKARRFYHMKSQLSKAGLLDDSAALSNERPRGGFAKVQLARQMPPVSLQQCEVKLPSGLAFCFDANLPTPTLRAIVVALGEITS